MKKQVLVACNGDWYTNLIHESLLELDFEVSQFNLRQNKDFNYVGNSFLTYLLKFFSKLVIYSFHIIPNKYYYRSYRVMIEYLFFDYLVSLHIRESKPDLCFLWTTMSSRSIKTAKKLGIKTVLFNGSAPLYQFRKDLRKINNKNYVFKKWDKLQAEEFTLSDKILVESKIVKNHIINLCVDPEKIFIISPHVSKFKAKRIYSNNFNFCTIQINDGKGIGKLLNYWKILNNLNNTSLHLIGSVSKNNQRLLHNIPNIKLHGFLKKKDYKNVLSTMDVALFPTYSDAGPRALFEAMAMGICPIISERSAGPDHITDFVTGFVIPLDDTNSWIEKILWCYNNPNEVRQIGQNARRYVEENLNVIDYSKKIKELVKEL